MGKLGRVFIFLAGWRASSMASQLVWHKLEHWTLHAKFSTRFFHIGRPHSRQKAEASEFFSLHASDQDEI